VPGTSRRCLEKTLGRLLLPWHSSISVSSREEGKRKIQTSLEASRQLLIIDVVSCFTVSKRWNRSCKRCAHFVWVQPLLNAIADVAYFRRMSRSCFINDVRGARPQILCMRKIVVCLLNSGQRNLAETNRSTIVRIFAIIKRSEGYTNAVFKGDAMCIVYLQRLPTPTVAAPLCCRESFPRIGVSSLVCVMSQRIGSPYL
jgi:hypothetical protein